MDVTFQTYKAITRVHLGALEKNLEKGQLVQFDGSTLIMGDQKVTMPELRGAIRIGWLVPENSTQTEYKPQPSGVKVHSAINRGENQEQITVNTVTEDERSVGTVKSSKTIPTQQEDGKVVARFKKSARSGSVRVDEITSTTINQIDNSTVDVEKVNTPKATGDVQEAIAGDTLQDVLPEAVSTGTPQTTMVTESPLTDTQQAQIKVDMIKAFVPSFQYDTTAHWKTRVKTALQYKDNSVVINTILGFETDAVVKNIKKGLAQ